MGGPGPAAAAEARRYRDSATTPSLPTLLNLMSTRLRNGECGVMLAARAAEMSEATGAQGNAMLGILAEPFQTVAACAFFSRQCV